MPEYRSPAKINLHLEVGPKRKDGYHSIRTILAKVRLADIIQIASSFPTHASWPSWRIDEKFTFCLRFVKGYPKLCRQELLQDPENNLVVKTYRILKERGFRLTKSLCLTLVKRVPTGAGLGGGSSNAAIVLKALAQKVAPRPAIKDLEKIAARLGSDVSFFLNQSALAWVTGRGERVKALPGLKRRTPLVIVYPGFGVSTEEAYGFLEARRRFFLTRKQVLDKLYRLGPRGLAGLNSFEVPIFKNYPSLRRSKVVLGRLGSLSVGLAGSGSCIFGFAQSKPQADSWIKNLKNNKEFKNHVYYATEIAR